MTIRRVFALVLALFWGAVWASVLQFTRMGRFLAERRTWVTVVVGVGGDLLITLLVLPLEHWLLVFSIIALSAIGIIARSLANEICEEQAITETMVDVAKNGNGARSG